MIHPVVLQYYQDRRCAYKHKNGARSYNHCCSGKAISIKILSVRLWPYVSNKQCTRAILSSVARLALQNSSTLSQKRQETKF